MKASIRTRRLTWFVAAILVLVTIAAFQGVLRGQFLLYDDPEYVTENSWGQAGLTRSAVMWAFTSTGTGNWHPLTWLSHMLDCTLFGLNPAGHHAVSLLLHAANVLLLFLILNRMTKSVWRSAFVAALFAIHPLHVESVAWVAERKDVLSTFFWMLTMGAYALYAESPTRSRYAAVVVLLALGLMAKPMLVTLPFVLLLLDYWPLGRFKAEAASGARPTPWPKLVLEKAPLLVLCAASSIITYIAQRSAGAVSTLGDISLGGRAANALGAYAAYMGKAIWPRMLAVFYPHPDEPLAMQYAAVAVLALAAVTLLAIRARRSGPYLLAGWLWYLASLVPVIGLVQVGGQAMADRYTYVPLIGLFIMVAWGIPELLGRGKRLSLTFTGIACVVVLVLAALTRTQVSYWRNDLTLFNHALEATEDNYLAHSFLGLALAKEKKFDEAIAHHVAGIKIAPGYAGGYDNFAQTLTDAGRLEEAARQLRAGLQISPNDSSLHNSLGVALAALGQLEEATAEYRKAIDLNPNWFGAYYNVGNVYAVQGKLDDAAEHYRKALSIDPDLRVARNRLQSVLELQKAQSQAVDLFSKAVRQDPGSAAAHYNLGLALQNQGKMDPAAREYREALRLKPDYGRAHKNLAVALFDKGKYAEAWKEVHLCRKHGASPHPDFIRVLAEKMPDPSP